MKNINSKRVLESLLLIVFTLCIFSCNENPLNGDDGNNLKTGQIEIKAYPYPKPTKISFYATAKKITINWGGGSVDEYTPNGVDQTFTHYYSNSNFQTITINTENIKSLSFDDGDIRELRIGKCSELVSLSYAGGSQSTQYRFGNLTVLEINDAPKLMTLDCSGNRLTSLDVSKCPALTALYCGSSIYTWSILDSNQLNTNELNELFKGLPTRQQSENAKIYINGNPGASDCDRTIAEKKMWTVH